MKNCFSFSCLSLLVCLFVAACTSDDDGGDFTGNVYEAPTFTEFEWTPATGTPQEQIDRFVAVNNLDTLVSPEGLVYKIIDPGEASKPTANSIASAFYIGTFVDGTIFDASLTRATSFALSLEIEGWQIGVPLIGRNGRIILIVRPDLGYKQDGRPARGITGSSVLVFEIVLADFAE